MRDEDQAKQNQAHRASPNLVVVPIQFDINSSVESMGGMGMMICHMENKEKAELPHLEGKPQ